MKILILLLFFFSFSLSQINQNGYFYQFPFNSSEYKIDAIDIINQNYLLVAVDTLGSVNNSFLFLMNANETPLNIYQNVSLGKCYITLYSLTDNLTLMTCIPKTNDCGAASSYLVTINEINKKIDVDKIYTFGPTNCGAWYAGYDGQQVWYLDYDISLNQLNMSSINPNKKTRTFTTTLLNAQGDYNFAFESGFYNNRVFSAVSDSNDGRKFIFVNDVVTLTQKFFFGIYGEDLMFLDDGYVLLWKSINSVNVLYADIYRYYDNQFIVTGNNITINGCSGYPRVGYPMLKYGNYIFVMGFDSNSNTSKLTQIKSLDMQQNFTQISSFYVPVDFRLNNGIAVNDQFLFIATNNNSVSFIRYSYN